MLITMVQQQIHKQILRAVTLLYQVVIQLKLQTRISQVLQIIQLQQPRQLQITIQLFLYHQHQHQE
ncbi:MAG: hypothetical protein CBC05_09190 [Crocinitomicaceae bacterium TMED45]|nr:MAG: hypothetical protein CBC05_09190 [Crocinitomicaceae bacterium TMED45]